MIIRQIIIGLIGLVLVAVFLGGAKLVFAACPTGPHCVNTGCCSGGLTRVDCGNYVENASGGCDLNLTHLT